MLGTALVQRRPGADSVRQQPETRTFRTTGRAAVDCGFHEFLCLSSTNPFQRTSPVDELGNVVGIEPLTGDVLWEYENGECHIPMASAVDAGENRVLIIRGTLADPIAFPRIPHSTPPGSSTSIRRRVGHGRNHVQDDAGGRCCGPRQIGRHGRRLNLVPGAGRSSNRANHDPPRTSRQNSFKTSSHI